MRMRLFILLLYLSCTLQNSSQNVIQQEWFKVSSHKLSNPSMVEDFLSSFKEISNDLLSHVVNMQDANVSTRNAIRPPGRLPLPFWDDSYTEAQIYIMPILGFIPKFLMIWKQETQTETQNRAPCVLTTNSHELVDSPHTHFRKLARNREQHPKTTGVFHARPSKNEEKIFVLFEWFGVVGLDCGRCEKICLWELYKFYLETECDFEVDDTCTFGSKKLSDFQ